MTKKIALAASLLMALAGTAQAQSATACSCNAGATRIVGAGLVDLLSNRMVCAKLENDTWQEWHNGTSSGPLVDYKMGRNDPRDPSTTVGSYNVSATASTVTYTYGSGGAAVSYPYQVCLVSATNTYTFCGARTITGARIGGAGLTSCSLVTNFVQLTTKDVRPKK